MKTTHLLRGATLLGIALLSSTTPVSAQSTRRSAIYFFTEDSRDILSAHAYDYRVPTNTDSAQMQYSLLVDGPMIAQLAETHFRGGTVAIQFTVRQGLSFVGAGTGTYSGTVSVSPAVCGPYDFSASGPSGTIDTTYTCEIPPGTFDEWSLGDTITVTLSGQGTAWSNGDAYRNQSIVTWYFKASGKPMLKAMLPPE
jgi:hypothetical protein